MTNKPCYTITVRTICLFFLLSVWCTPALAQYTLQGVMSDSSHHLLSDIPVQLVSTDSASQYNTVTDKLGKFTFNNLTQQRYQLKINSVNYQLAGKLIIPLQRDTFITVNLSDPSRTLKEITVTSSRPVFKKEIDRFVFNVQNTSLVAGNNIWGVLTQTPMVNAQESGTLSLLGTQGVSVYINNRKSVLSGKDLQQYLSSIPSDNIQQIEVFTMPPSKYEAGNPGGVINIVLKKNEAEGLNGSVGVTDNQATYNSQSGNIALNYRSKKYGQQLTVNSGSRRGYYYSDNDITYTGKQKELIHNQTIKKPENYTGFSTSADYTISPKSVIGAVAEYRTAHANDYNSGYNIINYIDSGQKEEQYYNENPERRNTNYLSFNLNYQFTDPKRKQELMISADYFDYQNDQLARFLSFNRSNPDSVHSGYRNATSQHIRNYAVKADYTKTLAGNIKLETGVRFSRTQTNNDLLSDNYVTGEWIINTNRSNKFRYKESIAAAYVSLYRKFNEHVEVKAGGRIEETSLETAQITSKQTGSRQYFNFFPTAYLNYTINDKNVLSFAVRSDIRRPSYSQLNPFINIISDKYLVKGNPELRPSNSMIAEITYTLNKDYIFIARYTRENHLFEQIAIVIPPDTTLLDRFNYGNSDEWGLTSIINKSLMKNKWKITLTNSFSLFKQSVDVPQVMSNTRNFLYMCNLSQQFSNIFNSKIDVSFNGSYLSKIVSANSEITGFGEVGIGLLRKIPAWNTQLSLYAGDIFNTQRLKHFYSINDFSVSDMTGFSDTRFIRITITQKIGSNKIKAVKRKSTSNGEEANRVQ
ncbi:outer membrane beta-barrel protein [Chitinophaga sp. RAB17]|uniref:outer membrane beta-barrel protein n=1 Tax=Chitinophaga sp. RAB17 TaxID=3233049 RepID=UPI003F91B752